VTYSLDLGGIERLLGFELVQECGQVSAGDGPLEGSGNLLASVLAALVESTERTCFDQGISGVLRQNRRTATQPVRFAPAGRKLLMNARHSLVFTVATSALVSLGLVLGADTGPQRSCQSAGVDSQKRWSRDKAWEWHEKVGPIRGFNYDPRYAVNDVELWQADTFNLEIIDQELGWAQEAGYNSLRVFVPYPVWKGDPEGLKKRFDQFLTVAYKHDIAVTPVLFCAGDRVAQTGKQGKPIPGVHNSRAVQWPGPSVVLDRSAWAGPEKFVRDIVGAFTKDKRIIMWDIFNEPDNSSIKEGCLPLVEAACEWARSVHPSQPLTIGPWHEYESKFSQRLMDLSDIVSFHNYESPENMRATIEICRKADRPVVCTEWLRRQVGNTFAAILPVFAEFDVGWYNWGLVAGRTQTYLWWESREGDSAPKVWQHDILHPNGAPFDPAEIELIRSWHPRRCPHKRMNNAAVPGLVRSR